MSWWSLPGPSSYVDEIVSELREGKNVIIWLPEHTPTGLRDVVRSTLGLEIPWKSLDGDISDFNSPLDGLFQHFPCQDGSECNLRRISALLENESFIGNILWLNDVPKSNYSSWLSFISEYAHACRNINLMERTVFCLLINGEIEQPLNEDVCLSVKPYQDKVQTLDMRIYVAQQSKYLSGRGLLEDLRQEIIIFLAQWDESLVKNLLKSSLSELLNAEILLKQVAQERGWVPEQCFPDAVSWAKGCMYRVNDRSCKNSCILAQENNGEIRHLIWIAQLRILYPYIEEQRQAIIQQHKAKLRVPFVTQYKEVIDNIHDLEIGHIETILSGNRNCSHALLDRIRTLRKIRNCLAHLELVDTGILNTKAICEPL